MGSGGERGEEYEKYGAGEKHGAAVLWRWFWSGALELRVRVQYEDFNGDDALEKRGR